MTCPKEEIEAESGGDYNFDDAVPANTNTVARPAASAPAAITPEEDAFLENLLEKFNL